MEHGNHRNPYGEIHHIQPTIDDECLAQAQRLGDCLLFVRISMDSTSRPVQPHGGDHRIYRPPNQRLQRDSLHEGPRHENPDDAGQQRKRAPAQQGSADCYVFTSDLIHGATIVQTDGVGNRRGQSAR